MVIVDDEHEVAGLFLAGKLEIDFEKLELEMI